jgi:hypothetical protein
LTKKWVHITHHNTHIHNPIISVTLFTFSIIETDARCFKLIHTDTLKDDDLAWPIISNLHARVLLFWSLAKSQLTHDTSQHCIEMQTSHKCAKTILHMSSDFHVHRCSYIIRHRMLEHALTCIFCSRSNNESIEFQLLY